MIRSGYTHLQDGILPNEMMRLATLISPLSRDLCDGTLPNMLRFADDFLRLCCTTGLLRLFPRQTDETLHQIQQSIKYNMTVLTRAFRFRKKYSDSIKFVVQQYSHYRLSGLEQEDEPHSPVEHCNLPFTFIFQENLGYPVSRSPYTFIIWR